MQPIAKVRDIPEGRGKLVSFKGREIALFKDNGKVFALQNACPHRGGPLAEGDVEDGHIVCPWHRWAYALDSGKCRTLPGFEAPCFKVEVKGDDVFVEC